MFDRARPFDFAERRMDGHKPARENDAGQQDGHGLAVLAPGMVDGDESTGPDHLPAL